MTKESEGFFTSLPLVSDFNQILANDNYRELPQDWDVFATDVANSTSAIESGDYKAVNILGAGSITAALNAADGAELPYCFGGDGAIICAPPQFSTEIEHALAQLVALSTRAYGLQLRAGRVPVSAVKNLGKAIFVSRFGVSEFFSQAVFTGGGIELAEKLIKESGSSGPFAIKVQNNDSPPNLEGLECRWQDIPSPHEETVCLLVKATGETEPDSTTYRRLLSKIEECYGKGKQCHPVPQKYLRLALSANQLKYENTIRKNQPSLSWPPGLAGLRLITIFGGLLMKFNISLGGTNWGRYREDVANSTDVRKFDDMYRQVLSGTRASREELTAFLDAERMSGKLVYGVHASDRALMTCVIFDRSSRHTHFVDAADGGYALAGKQLKEQLAAAGGA
ncbi:MAG: DUF3095 domain-containing protein [Bdellovibrionales bacterium]|nr:DUF3095 domain-containing protein [Bdellovibrionales bacterium]